MSWNSALNQKLLKRFKQKYVSTCLAVLVGPINIDRYYCQNIGMMNGIITLIKPILIHLLGSPWY
jgi:hypothetical protein